MRARLHPISNNTGLTRRALSTQPECGDRTLRARDSKGAGLRTTSAAGGDVGQGSLRPGSLLSEENKFRRPYKRPPPFLVPSHVSYKPPYHWPQRIVCFSYTSREQYARITPGTPWPHLSTPGDRQAGSLGGFISVHMTETHHMKEGRRKACDAQSELKLLTRAAEAEATTSLSPTQKSTENMNRDQASTTPVRVDPG